MKIVTVFVLLSMLISGCTTNRWDIDTSDIQINQHLYRFDTELFSTTNPDSIWNNIPLFEKKYGDFFDIYNRAIIKIGGTNELDYADKLAYFLTDPYISEAYRQAQYIFKNNAFYTKLHKSFKRYHFYFPNKDIPNIYTHISGFNQSLVLDSSYISISLDKYLGTDSKFYKMLRTPMYLRQNMYPEKIPTDAMYAWALTEFNYNDKKDNLANQMIYYGKLHLFLDAMFPETADTVKWGMSSKKLKWCHKNETEMWVYLVENKLLFSSKYKDIRRFIDDGPFTNVFSKKSPARTGQWLGYRIVSSYMKNNDVSLEELMNNDNYKMILDKSKYKP